MKKSTRTKALIGLLIIFIGLAVLWFLRPPQATGVTEFGVTFSPTFSGYLGISWRDAYQGILDDLKVKAIRLPVYWPEIEKKQGEFDFSGYDYLMDEARKRDVKVTLTVGERVPRWPECHTPGWARSFSEADRQKALRIAITETVERYKNDPALEYWQVENEPFLKYFGDCPPLDISALDQEIQLVKFLDPHHPIVVTDSGELSTWFQAYNRADVFGTTMYRTVWSDLLSPAFGYITYPLPPRFFWLKANLVRVVYGNKPIIVSELQAEPWGPEFNRIATMSKEERAYSMSIDKFRENIEYAQEAGFPRVYLWGVEWWYYLKIVYNEPQYWDEAKKLF